MVEPRQIDESAIILVADDEEDIRDILGRILTDAGYDVILVEDGQAAVAAARVHPIHLAILDIQMPRLNGIEALRQIKSIDPQIQVLIITGNANLESLRATIVELDAFDYILKPFHREELLHTARNALAKRAYLKTAPEPSGAADRMARLEADLEERTRQYRESQIQYREIVENSGDGILIHQDDRLVFSNGNMTALTGYAAEEIRRVSFRRMLHHEDREMVIRHYQAVLHRRPCPTVCRFRFLRKSGDPVWIEAGNRRTLWDDRPAVLSFCRDIAERMAAEAALRRAHEDLEDRVRQRTVQLSRANARLKEEIAERRQIEDYLKSLLKKQEINIHLAKRILHLINGRPERHIPLSGGRSLFLDVICLPCLAEGGDHFFARTYRGPAGDRTVISLKDQSGHAVNCVLRSIATDMIHQALLKCRGDADVETSTRLLNDLICRSDLFQREDFATAITAVLHHRDGVLRYISNGHPPFLHIRGDQARLIPDAAEPAANIPLAWRPDARFRADSLTLETGDRIIFFTDGLNEMPHLHRNEILRLADLRDWVAEQIRREPALPVHRLMDRLLAHLIAHSGVTASDRATTSGDDVTLLGLEVESEDFPDAMEIRGADSRSLSRAIAGLYARIAGQWERAGFVNPEQRLYAVLEETICNAWRHGGKMSPDKPILARWRMGNDFVLEVSDAGDGFDFEAIPDPTRRENILSITGRGIMLIRHFAASVHWTEGGRRIRVSLPADDPPRFREKTRSVAEALDLWDAIH